MILAYKLVKLIETHSEGLAKALKFRIEQCQKCPNYKNVPEAELEQVVYGIYRHLGEWLLGKTEEEIANRYMAIGAERAAQGVPLSQVIWVIALVKDNLWDYLKQKNVMERPTEVFGELEMLQLLEQFFDRAQFYAAKGYEEAVVGMPR